MEDPDPNLPNFDLNLSLNYKENFSPCLDKLALLYQGFFLYIYISVLWIKFHWNILGF